MSATSRDRAAAAGLTALLAVAALTGCSSGDDKADADPRPTSSTSGTTTPSPSASSSTGVTPADGKLIETSYFTAHAPQHFSVDSMGDDFVIAINGPGADIGIGTIATDNGDRSLKELARSGRSLVDSLKGAPLGRTTTIGGEPAYLLLAKGPVSVTSEVGLIHGGQRIYMTVDSYHGVAENQRILQSILASWQWK